MSNYTISPRQSGLWRPAFVLAFGVFVLLACKISEELQIKKDGSGLYRAELTLVGEEKEMLAAVKEELAKQPQLRIVAEGPRDGDYALTLEQVFEDIAELSNRGSDYGWADSQDGLFARSVKLTLNNKPSDHEGLTEHRLQITMPGKVVASNAEKISGRKITWDRLAAGPRGVLEVEARYFALQPGFADKLWTAAVVLLFGVGILVGVRVLRRRRT